MCAPVAGTECYQSGNSRISSPEFPGFFDSNAASQRDPEPKSSLLLQKHLLVLTLISLLGKLCLQFLSHDSSLAIYKAACKLSIWRIAFTELCHTISRREAGLFSIVLVRTIDSRSHNGTRLRMSRLLRRLCGFTRATESLNRQPIGPRLTEQLNNNRQNSRFHTS